jgi:RluA family pseudouridine synthase
MQGMNKLIRYADEDILIVAKPPGIPVIPERGVTPEPSLQEQLQLTEGRLWIVHRIDRDTSGLVLMARNAEAHRELSLQFEGHDVRKEYLAIVQGTPPEEAAQIDIPLRPHATKNLMLVDHSGKPSTTLFKTVESFRRHTYLRLKILTGRRHQIRVHMAYMGNPLLVDPVYGGKDAFYLSQIKKRYKVGEEERPLISRLTLHAETLGFLHPVTREDLLFTEPLPADLEVVLKQLRKWDALNS